MRNVIINLYPSAFASSISFFTFLISYILTNSLHVSLFITLIVGISSYFIAQRISYLLMK
jgi:hypothetical protein